MGAECGNWYWRIGGVGEEFAAGGEEEEGGDVGGEVQVEEGGEALS